MKRKNFLTLLLASIFFMSCNSYGMDQKKPNIINAIPGELTFKIFCFSLKSNTIGEIPFLNEVCSHWRRFFITQDDNGNSITNITQLRLMAGNNEYNHGNTLIRNLALKLGQTDHIFFIALLKNFNLVGTIEQLDSFYCLIDIDTEGCPFNAQSELEALYTKLIIAVSLSKEKIIDLRDDEEEYLSVFSLDESIGEDWLNEKGCTLLHLVFKEARDICLFEINDDFFENNENINQTINKEDFIIIKKIIDFLLSMDKTDQLTLYDEHGDAPLFYLIHGIEVNSAKLKEIIKTIAIHNPNFAKQRLTDNGLKFFHELCLINHELCYKILFFIKDLYNFIDKEALITHKNLTVLHCLTSKINRYISIINDKLPERLEIIFEKAQQDLDFLVSNDQKFPSDENHLIVALAIMLQCMKYFYNFNPEMLETVDHETNKNPLEFIDNDEIRNFIDNYLKN